MVWATAEEDYEVASVIDKSDRTDKDDIPNNSHLPFSPSGTERYEKKVAISCHSSTMLDDDGSQRTTDNLMAAGGEKGCH